MSSKLEMALEEREQLEFKSEQLIDKIQEMNKEAQAIEEEILRYDRDLHKGCYDVMIELLHH